MIALINVIHTRGNADKNNNNDKEAMWMILSNNDGDNIDNAEN